MQPPGSYPSSLQLTQWQTPFYPEEPSDEFDELTTTSNEPVSASEVFFQTEDLLKSTWEHDCIALQLMRRVSKKQNELANKNWGDSTVRLLNEGKATFSDFEIKTKNDFVRFAEKLGEQRCKKITRLMLPTELISDQKENWNDWFGFEVTLHFPNISHLSFKTTFSQIPTGRNNKQNPLMINWSFLEKLPLLESIDFSSGYHNIGSIEFLKLVPQLKKLNLTCCESLNSQSFEVLNELSNLVEIDLTRCKVRDISFIKFMPNLKKLNLKGCFLHSGLERLASSQLKSLKITNLECLEYLKDLKTLEELNLSIFSFYGTKQINNIDHLKSLTRLKKLNLQGIEFSDLSFLSSLKNLEHLNLSKCSLGKILLPPLQKLISLDLSESFITKIDVGGHFPSLRDLKIRSASNLSNIDFVRLMENLESLDLSDILRIRSLEPCTKLTKLKTLRLQRCLGIFNLEVFSCLTSLKDLDLSQCSWVRDIDFLKNLSKLQSLNLLGCENLCSMEAVEFLTNLKFLSVDERFEASKFKCFNYYERDSPDFEN